MTDCQKKGFRLIASQSQQACRSIYRFLFVFTAIRHARVSMRVQGGRAKLHRIIYMNAICFITHNSKLKSHYKRLREAGKPVKKAIVAVMRKLVILMNRLLSDPSFELALEK